MDAERRMNAYRERVAVLACAIYNGENWDKGAVISYFQMGDPSLDYDTRGIPPERLEPDDVITAMDRMFNLKGF